MAQPTEFLPIVEKLLDKTRQGKIEWKPTYEEMVFICAIEGQYSFEIKKGLTSGGAGFRKLTMKGTGEEELVVFRAAYPTQQTSTENDRLFEQLDELYDRARRLALNIDEKVQNVSAILDKL